MKADLRILSLALFSVLLLFSPGFTQQTGSRELISNPGIYDGKIVVYQGEAIGDLMRRGDFAWINLHDGENALGIWLPLELAKEINYTGSYKSRGDIIEVTGVFNRVCPAHNGDLDIHAQSIRKISSGAFIKEKVAKTKVKQAFLLSGVLFFVWILTLLIRK